MHFKVRRCKVFVTPESALIEDRADDRTAANTSEAVGVNLDNRGVV
jgi:hypothetical protein